MFVSFFVSNNLVFGTFLHFDFSSSAFGKEFIASLTVVVALSIRKYNGDNIFTRLTLDFQEVGVGSRDGSFEFMFSFFDFERNIEQIVFHVF